MRIIRLYLVVCETVHVVLQTYVLMCSFDNMYRSLLSGKFIHTIEQKCLFGVSEELTPKLPFKEVAPSTPTSKLATVAVVSFFF